MVVLDKNVPCELERNMYSATINFNFCYFSVVKFPFDSVFITYGFFAENFYNTFLFVLRIFVLTLWSFVIAFLKSSYIIQHIDHFITSPTLWPENWLFLGLSPSVPWTASAFWAALATCWDLWAGWAEKLPQGSHNQIIPQGLRF